MPHRGMWPRRCWHRRSSQGAESNDKKSAGEAVADAETQAGQPDREALGRSRGGYTTKVHIAADTRCRPVARVVTAGQRHDSIAFDAVMANLRIERPGRGRPRTRPDRVLADKAYSSMAIRTALRARGIKATIPSKANEITGRAHRGSKGGRPPAFDKAAYKTRNVVERTINKLRQTRAVATRYDKREFVYRGTIDVASIRIWLRDPPETHSRDTA